MNLTKQKTMWTKLRFSNHPSGAFHSLGKRYCGQCANLLDKGDVNKCHFCRGYHKVPLGTKELPFKKFRWEK